METITKKEFLPCKNCGVIPNKKKGYAILMGAHASCLNCNHTFPLPPAYTSDSGLSIEDSLIIHWNNNQS